MYTSTLYKKPYVHILALALSGAVALVVYTWYSGNLFTEYRYDGSQPTGDGRLLYQIRTTEDAYPWYGYSPFGRLFVRVHLGYMPDGASVVAPAGPGALGVLLLTDPRTLEHVLIPLGPESLAYKRGVRAGDSLLHIQGESVRGVPGSVVSQYMDERPLSMTLLTESGRERTVTFTETKGPDSEELDLSRGVAYVYTPTIFGYVIVLVFWTVLALVMYYGAIALVSVSRAWRWWWRVPFFVVAYTLCAVAVGAGVFFVPGTETIVGFADAVERRIE